MNRNDLWLRLRALFCRKAVEEELDEELAFHTQMQVQKNLATGMDAIEARRQARIGFGFANAIKEECRKARGISFIEMLFQDSRYALRAFRRTPLFVLTVVGTIGLGLGWNTALFTIFNAYLLRPVTAVQPRSLYHISWQDRAGDDQQLTWGEYSELQTAHPGLVEVSSARISFADMDGRVASCLWVDGEYFHMLGMNAIRGRPLVPDDTRWPGSEPVVVLSYASWRNRFNARPDILGRKVSIDHYPFTVVGVMPKEFTGLGPVPPEVWVPITMSARIGAEPNSFQPGSLAAIDITGRLKPGESVEQARELLSAWTRRASPLAARTPLSVILRSESTALPLRAEIVGVFLIFGMAFLLVLLSACANVTNMMLARAMARQREIGIRLCLGAARWRLIQQLLTESILLGVPAGMAGFAVSQATIGMAIRVILATAPSEFVDGFRLVSLSPDLRVFAFMIGAVIAAALLFGLVPAIQATRMPPMEVAHGDIGFHLRPGRLRSALVMAQVIVCTFLLIGTGVLLNGATNAQRLNTGMRSLNVITMEIRELSRPHVMRTLTAERGIELAAVSTRPLRQTATVPALGANGSILAHVQYKFASPEYFHVLGISVVRGRDFSSQEAGSNAPVAILSESAAQNLWPNLDALGQTLHLTPDQLADRGERRLRYQNVQVVGIAKDAVVGNFDNPDRACLYLPTNLKASNNVLLARVQGDSATAMHRLKSVLEIADPNSIEDIHTMQELMASGAYAFRIAYWMSAAAGCITLLLTLSGIYGVLSYVVAQRAKEISIRMAMGANGGAVIGLVLKQCLRLAGMSIALGSAMALVASKFVSAGYSQTIINPFDRGAYLTGMIIVLIVCVSAAYFPARRAAECDPIQSLRND